METTVVEFIDPLEQGDKFTFSQEDRPTESMQGIVEGIQPIGQDHKFRFTRPRSLDLSSCPSSGSGRARAATQGSEEGDESTGSNDGGLDPRSTKPAHAEFILEELDDELDDSAEVVRPSHHEDAESGNENRKTNNQNIYDRLREMCLETDSSDSDQARRRYERKKIRLAKKRNSRIRSHSQSVLDDSTDSGADPLDDNDPTARRLRRRIRGPTDRRGSLIFRDYGYANTNNIIEIEEPDDQGIVYPQGPPSIPSDDAFTLEELPFWGSTQHSWNIESKSDVPLELQESVPKITHTLRPTGEHVDYRLFQNNLYMADPEAHSSTSNWVQQHARVSPAMSSTSINELRQHNVHGMGPGKSGSSNPSAKAAVKTPGDSPTKDNANTKRSREAEDSESEAFSSHSGAQQFIPSEDSSEEKDLSFREDSLLVETLHRDTGACHLEFTGPNHQRNYNRHISRYNRSRRLSGSFGNTDASTSKPILVGSKCTSSFIPFPPEDDQLKETSKPHWNHTGEHSLDTPLGSVSDHNHNRPAHGISPPNTRNQPLPWQIRKAFRPEKQGSDAQAQSMKPDPDTWCTTCQMFSMEETETCWKCERCGTKLDSLVDDPKMVEFMWARVNTALRKIKTAKVSRGSPSSYSLNQSTRNHDSLGNLAVAETQGEPSRGFPVMQSGAYMVKHTGPHPSLSSHRVELSSESIDHPTSIACMLCRIRGTVCDRKEPTCTLCSKDNFQCQYGVAHEVWRTIQRRPLGSKERSINTKNNSALTMEATPTNELNISQTLHPDVFGEPPTAFTLPANTHYTFATPVTQAPSGFDSSIQEEVTTPPSMTSESDYFGEWSSRDSDSSHTEVAVDTAPPTPTNVTALSPSHFFGSDMPGFEPHTGPETPTILNCDVEGCNAIYLGADRRADLVRHKRQSHQSLYYQYPCEDQSCDRFFLTLDGRLEHYRKDHPHLAYAISSQLRQLSQSMSATELLPEQGILVLEQDSNGAISGFSPRSPSTKALSNALLETSHKQIARDHSVPQRPTSTKNKFETSGTTPGYDVWHRYLRDDSDEDEDVVIEVDTVSDGEQLSSFNTNVNQERKIRDLGIETIQREDMYPHSGGGATSTSSSCAPSVISVFSVESLASSATDLSKASGYSPTQIATATKVLISIFHEDIILRPLYREAIDNPIIGPERLQRNLRRLIKAYAGQLAHESTDRLEYLASRLVSLKARWIAESIIERLCSRPISPQAVAVDQQDESSDDEPDDRPLVSETVFDDLVVFREFLTGSNAFEKLRAQVRLFVSQKATDTSTDRLQQLEVSCAKTVFAVPKSRVLHCQSWQKWREDVADVADGFLRHPISLPATTLPAYLLIDAIRLATDGILITAGLLEPPLQPNKTRLRWNSKCGETYMSDVTELREDGAAELVARMEKHSGLKVSATRYSSGTTNQQYISPQPCRWLRNGLNKLTAAFTRSSKASPCLPQHNASYPSSTRTSSQTTISQPSILHLLACMHKNRFRKVLHQDRIETIETDRALLCFMRQQYKEHRGRVMHFFSLKSVKGILFVKFRLPLGGSVDVRHHDPCCVSTLGTQSGCECIPPKDKVEPSPQAEYRCVPGPPATYPPVPPEYLRSLFMCPANVDEKDTWILNQLPKRTCGKLQGKIGQPADGWGIYYQDDWDREAISVCVAAIFFIASLLFGVLYVKFQHDAQAAFGISAYIVAVCTILLSLAASKLEKRG